MESGEQSGSAILDILGGKGTLRKPVVEAFREKRVTVSKQAVSNLRGGWMNGEIIQNRLKCSERLSSDDASLKDNLYLAIANEAVDLRTPQARFPQRFNTNNYMETLAGRLGKNQHDVARLIRAMRADLVSTDPDNPGHDQNLATLFLGLAGRYIRDYSGPYPSVAHPPIKALDQNWNHKTIKDFYRALSIQGVRAVTTWVPYEMEAMIKFYEDQILKSNHLTPFDKQALGVILQRGKSDADLAAQIRTESGVNVGSIVIEEHRNSLVYGFPESVLRSRKL